MLTAPGAVKTCQATTSEYYVADPSSILPTTADQVLISVNPKAGRKSPKIRAEQLTELLKQNGLGVEVFTDLALVSAKANELHAEGRLRALVGVGGDGTAAELVNRTEPGVPVTLLSSGTANLLSKYCKFGRTPKRLCQTIVGGHLRTLDAGRANGRLFLIMVSCGFDAEVVNRVHTHRQTNRKGGHIGYLSYIKPIVDSIRTYKYPTLRIDCEGIPDRADDDKLAINGRWAFVFNLPCYGWGLPLTPRAVGTDGILDVCSFRGRSLAAGVRYVAGAHLGGLHGRMPDCSISRARRFRISSEEEVTYQLDGDPGGVLPVEIEVLPDRLTLVVPESRKGR